MGTREKLPTISVIVAVYNHFNWLRLILDALGMQTCRDFEVVIADDGSSAETVERIKEYIATHPDMRIKHSWQPDEGWRKNRSLNKAVRTSEGDYLIFVDGDCIPHPRFVADHMRMAAPGIVVGGRRTDMCRSLSDRVAEWESLPANYFGIARRKTLGAIFSQPLKDTFAQLGRLIRVPFIAGRPFMPKDTGFLGCNFGLYRKDLEAVNGFDERYLAPGTGEDSDLDERLRNNGMKRIKVSHHALQLHRRHKRFDMTDANNLRLFDEARANHVTWVENGLISSGASSGEYPHRSLKDDNDGR